MADVPGSRVDRSPAVHKKYRRELQSLLLESAGQGRLDAVRTLMKHQPDILQCKGEYGSSVAHIAAYYGHWHVLSFLSKVNSKYLFAEADDGGTPAHHAAAAGRTETLKYIASQSLSHMVARDHDGWTPAHVASHYGQTEVLMLMAKVSPSVFGIKTNDGKTPIQLARTPECKQLVLCLEKLVLTASGGRRDKKSEAHDEHADLMELLSQSFSNDHEVGLDCSEPRDYGGKGNSVNGERQRGGARAGGGKSERHSSGTGGDRNEGGHGVTEANGEMGDQNEDCGKVWEETPSTKDASKLSRSLEGNLQGSRVAQSEASHERNRGQESVQHDTSEDGRSGDWKQDVTTKEQEGKWKLLLADLRKGADLTSMLIPAEFIRPQSVLERLAFLMQHGRYLENISLAQNPLDRIKAVISFHLSGLVREVFDGKKPYNPVLGETCAWAFLHPEPRNGVTRMVCEQVSHHPPISALHIHNEVLGINLEGAALIEAKFTGNTVLVPFKGVRKLTIRGVEEEYILTYPSLQYRGVMLGPKGAEWIGKIEIRCAKSKLVAKLDFQPMGWLGMWGAWHRVEGAITTSAGKKEVVGTISGNWDKKVSFKCAQTGRTETLYDYEWAASHAKLQLVDTPGASLPTNSLKVWGKVSDALRAKDYRAANKAKKAVEVAERAKRAARDIKKTLPPFKPLFFRQENDEWMSNKAVIAEFHAKAMNVVRPDAPEASN